jgi:aminoglycoside phosphotransferase (APT) family kinase protein
MIRQHELHQFITAISDTLAGPIMADLRSDGTKRMTGVLLMLLDRIASDLADGDAIAARNLETWAALEALSLGLKLTRPEAALPVREQFGARIGAVQQTLAEPARLEGFIRGLRSNNARTVRWLHDTSDLLLGVHSDIEASYAAQSERSVEKSEDRGPALRAALVAYLSARFAELPAEPVLEFAVVAGGFSKITALFTLPPNEILPERLVLRLDIENAITQAVLAEEYPVLERVYALGLPVPKPILFEPDAKYLGGAFVIMEQIVDAVVAGSPFYEDRRKTGANIGPEFGVEMARLAGRLHGATLEPRPDREVGLARERSIAVLAEEWRGMEKSPFSLQLDLGLAWMAAHRLPEDRPVSLMHGDFALHNVLTRDGRLVALLDWELARRGDPAEDMALIKMMNCGGIIAWDDFVREYLAAGGPAEAVDPHAVNYYAIVLYVQHGVNFARMRHHYLRGERKDLEAMICASHFQERINLYQAKALREALGGDAPGDLFAGVGEGS